MSQWLLDRAKTTPQGELRVMLTHYLPKCQGMFAQKKPLDELFNFYNAYLNPSKIKETPDCNECRVKIVNYFSYLARSYSFN